MKSAKEWLNYDDGDNGFSKPTEEQIIAIQRDALKHAAQIAEQTTRDDCGYFNNGCFTSAENILAEAAKLKPEKHKTMEYCDCEKPIVIKGARGLGDYCAGCAKWYEEKSWRSGMKERQIKSEQSAAMVDDIILVGKETELREQEQLALRESRRLRNRVKKWIWRIFGRN